MTMKLGTIDVDVALVMQGILGDQAEALRVVSIEDGGRSFRVLIKAPAEIMPDGSAESQAEIPHMRCEVAMQRHSVKFWKL